MTTTADADTFEKTIRLTCRLDDSEIDYVRDTAEWIARCVRRALVLDPMLTAQAVTPTVLDMSTHGRYRLMKPESVAEQLVLPPAPPAN